MSKDTLSMVMRSRLAALGVEANHEAVARRLDAWDAQIAAVKRRMHEPLRDEIVQSSLPLGKREHWPRSNDWPKKKGR